MELIDGFYTGVYVVDITTTSTLLSNGTGTVINGVLGCGIFEDSCLYPSVNDHFKITGYDQDGASFEEDNVECIYSGETSEFK